MDTPKALTPIELRDAARLLEQLIAPCDGGPSDHAWRNCKRCTAMHGVEMRFGVSIRLLGVALAALTSPAPEPSGDELQMRTLLDALDDAGLTPGATIAALQRRLHVGAADAMRLLAVRAAADALTPSPVEPSGDTAITARLRATIYDYGKPPCSVFDLMVEDGDDVCRHCRYGENDHLIWEAASTIDALRQEQGRLTEALRLSQEAHDETARGFNVYQKQTEEALRSAREQGWQDMSTAPKDGTVVLGFRARTTSGVPGTYRHATRFDGYNWLTDPGKYTWGPTHWMPLPPTPAGETT